MAIDSKQGKTVLAAIFIILVFVSAFVVLNFKEVRAADPNTKDLTLLFAVDASTYGGWKACSNMDNGQSGADTYCQCFGYKNASSCYYEIVNIRNKWTPGSTIPCCRKDDYTKNGGAATKIRCNCYDTEVNCSDAVDNDCDGYLDKADDDCPGTAPNSIDLTLPISVDAWLASGWDTCYYLDDYKTGADTYCRCKGYDAAVSCYYEDKMSRNKWTPKSSGICYSKDGVPDPAQGTAVTKIKCRCYETEINCSDEIDNDCDGYADINDTDDCKECIDSDEDGYDACDEFGNPMSGCDDPCDCNDNVAEINPGAVENCTNTIDDDCDKLTDCNDIGDCADDPACEEKVKCTDTDGDNYAIEGGDCGSIDCNDSDSAVYPGAAEVCDGKDNDCDESYDEDFDSDGDTYTTCGTSTEDGSAVTKDCNDEDGDVNPGEIEICDNRIDDDCDGLTDLEDADCQCEEGAVQPCYSGPEGTLNVGVCAAGNRTCLESGLWGACTGEVIPGIEICDGEDDDCNGVIDDVDGGASIAETKCGCYDGALPSAENTTNRIDDNCDGALDANEADLDGDGFAIFEGDCDDENPNVNPLADENCINGIDDNCNGETDEGCTSTGGGGGHGGGSRSSTSPTSATFTIGNGKCEVGESAENACIDCGCLPGKKCVNNMCVLENPAAAAAAQKVAPPPETPRLADQISLKSVPLLGLLLIILFAVITAGAGSYYYLHHKPRQEYIKFAELKTAKAK